MYRYAITNFPISIHAPVKGATCSARSLLSLALDFNPRSREGSDLLPAACIYIIWMISIHAPVKGATR